MPAGAGVKRQCLKGGYEIRGLKEGSALSYPKVASLPANSVLSFHVACGNPAGTVVEVRTNGIQGAGWGDVECLPVLAGRTIRT
jgi:hypothetical protein